MKRTDFEFYLMCLACAIGCILGWLLITHGVTLL